jgi:uncharacterized membrane protein
VKTTRLEAFSDGVFAIAITLLVLDLAIPDDGSPWERVVDAWPFYLAYVVSFLTSKVSACSSRCTASSCWPSASC